MAHRVYGAIGFYPADPRNPYILGRCRLALGRVIRIAKVRLKFNRLADHPARRKNWCAHPHL